MTAETGRPSEGNRGRRHVLASTGLRCFGFALGGEGWVGRTAKAHRESNLPAQQFFKDRDFSAVDVLRGHYDDTAEDAYLMQYSLDAQSTYVPKNRISEYDAA